jgi:hypothetical protein
MAREITSFTGNKCVVGRGWAPACNESGASSSAGSDRMARLTARLVYLDIPWYLTSNDEHHDPATTYYIDINKRCAADLVHDISKPIPQTLQQRFDFLLLEYIPLKTLMDGQTWTNAADMLRPGAMLEVQSNRDTLTMVAGKLVGFESSFEISQFERHMTQPAKAIHNYIERRKRAQSYDEEDHEFEAAWDKHDRTAIDTVLRLRVQKKQG